MSLENGIVLNFDARTLPSDLTKPSPARFMLAAHDGAASALDVNPHIRGCIVTGGTDKMVKVWNINDKSDGKKDVSLAISRDLGVVRCFISSNHGPCSFYHFTGQGLLDIVLAGRSFMSRCRRV